MPEIRDAGPGASSDELAALESLIGLSIPKEYLEFLMAQDGGRPAPNIIDVPGLPGTPTDVQVLFGIRRTEATSCIAWNLALVRERCAVLDLLPVACDSGGNVFCLQCGGAARQSLVYCDLDSGLCQQYPVAASYRDFLAALRHV